ncbi:hypothetical protein M8542_37200 [Amycolatopsis sp. OK19-0408]|uniref:Uncharacterized protein n=1 Tax=Amycolatopsis iheyensis TaxID=2945988 RepID=A0A9X2NJ84_9PSEU|nr:hypothetical protein [Amycolatopsis iheyensis]MCR6488481.1 hypothetical protein [Amycolatopsis iheyensis]
MIRKALAGLLAAGAATLTLGAPAFADEVTWGMSTEVAPGGQIYAQVLSGVGNGCTPAGPVTSKGFAAPLNWTEGGNWGKHAGYTTAIGTPGKYTASFPCTDGREATQAFTILGTPPPKTSTKPPTTTAKPKPKPTATSKPAKAAKPQVAVKPAGAPQTGDGSLS